MTSLLFLLASLFLGNPFVSTLTGMDKDEKFDLEYFKKHEVGGLCSYQEGNNTIRLFDFDDVYVKQIEPDDPDEMVCTQVTYYGETLGVKETGKYLKHGETEIGVWESYNQDGTLDHTEDLDEDYPISWYQLVDILKENEIVLSEIDSISRYYDEEQDSVYWSIIILLKNEGDKREEMIYIFDARTGNLIKKESMVHNVLW